MTSPAPDKLPGRPEQRRHLINGAVDYVLDNGVSNLSLRALAPRLGTSDRMLLYYFVSRESLITEVLDRISTQLQDALGAGVSAGRMPPGALLRESWRLLSSSVHDAPLRLYFEVAALAARGQQPYLTVSERITDSWRSWLVDCLELPPRHRGAGAAALLATIDGLLLHRLSADPASAERAAEWIGRVLDGSGALR